QVAHARVRVRSRAGGIRPGPQQLRPGARRPHGPAGLPRPQLHPHRGRSAVESRPPHLHPAPAVGCRQDAGVRPAAARGGDPGGVVVSARWLAIAFAVVLACPVLAQQPPNNDDMMESPPVAAPREGYWADVLAHDPVMARQGDTWYLFVTGPGITVYSSRDMETWKAETPVFPEIPAWAYDIVPRFNGHVWAPDISFHDGTWYLYYSISSGGSNASAIGVATNTTLDPADPDYRWVDHGIVRRSVPHRYLWNAIDANLVEDDDGTPWLAFGSFWGGLKLVKLREDRLGLAEPQVWHTLARRERPALLDDADPGPGAVEAPFVFRRDGWYYLFVSYDHCCRGAKSDYRIMVGRSRTLAGPYL